MELVWGLEGLERLVAAGAPRLTTVLTIGKFDGLHIAHQTLIAGAIRRAREFGVACTVMSLDPDPDFVLRGIPVVRLTTLDTKAQLIAELGADRMILQPFTREFAAQPAEDFVSRLAQTMDLCEIHVGEDFAFGYKAQGNVALLRTLGSHYNYSVQTLGQLRIGDEVVSSSRIRQLLAAGDVTAANRLLGRLHRVQGEVVHGDKRGRTIGYPTANMIAYNDFSIPANGIYASLATVMPERPPVTWQMMEQADPPRIEIAPTEADAQQRHFAATSIGVRPQFLVNADRNIESYLLDFDADIYGRQLRVEFVQYMRGEAKFDSLDGLLAQMAQDVAGSRAVLQSEAWRRQ